MKKTIRILIPIILALAIVFCLVWYLFIYDRAFTRDMLLTGARYFESQGNHSVAAWFYDCAYRQAGDNDAVAIELAEQHKAAGNYTQAEATLSQAIEDGGGVELYIALCKTYAEQDKLLDCVTLLNSITNEEIKAQLDQMRPAAPTALPEPGFYNQYISVTIDSPEGTLYVNAQGEYPSVQTDAYTAPITLHDGENNIYAITVADNGLVSPLAIFGYTVGGVIEEVTFSDAAMELEIRTLLNADSDAILYSNDLWSITEFTVPADAASYADLKYMTFLESLTVEGGVSGELSVLSSLSNLVTLTIRNTSVSSEELSVIGALPNLTTLTLSGCSLSTTAGLENATAVTYLDLSDNTIRNISALASMTNVREAYLQSNAITDLSSLSAMTALTKLNISGNAVTSLSPICGLTELVWLNANNNSLTGLQQIGNLTALKELYVTDNSLTDISALTACTALEKLCLDSNKLTDLSGLSALNKLMVLTFSYNEVTQLPAFSKSCALVTIDGSHNLLTSLDKLSDLANLNNVFMDYNEGITSVDCLAACPVLIQVDVYGTAVTDVSALTKQSIIVNYDPTQR